MPDEKSAYDLSTRQNGIWKGLARWMMDKVVKHGTCIVCGHEREIMTLPATQ
jgi:hypothetical protein